AIAVCGVQPTGAGTVRAAAADRTTGGYTPALASISAAGRASWVREAKAVTPNRPVTAMTIASTNGLPLAPSARAAVAAAAPVICVKLIRPEAAPMIRRPTP